MYSGSDLSVLWLKNIKNLDSKNRLVHGEIYSKDGSILDFEIEGNSVKAKVEGAPGDIFDVEIAFRQISNSDREFITDYIFKNYFLFSELLNDNIPEELFDTKVKLLPDSLKDFKIIENYLSEYWSIFDFINKGYLLSLKEFKNRFMKPIENERDMEVLEDFKKITSPFILRRHKSDKAIIKDLPEKVINDVYCNLTLKQASLYDETLNTLIRDVEDSVGIQRKGLVLKLINSLKQICNHPSHYLKLDEFEIEESGKMQVLMNILENIINSDESVLIFSQYVEMGKIIKRLAKEKFGREVLFLHGSVPRRKRDEMIDRFQNGEAKIFLLSLKAGGIGLNLTAATNVIHYDLWWNPAVENQATDRAYRIGQKDNVMVYRFITTGTLEELINQILLDKRELAEITIEGNEKFITEMSNEDLKEMLKLRE